MNCDEISASFTPTRPYSFDPLPRFHGLVDDKKVARIRRDIGLNADGLHARIPALRGLFGCVNIPQTVNNNIAPIRCQGLRACGANATRAARNHSSPPTCRVYSNGHCFLHYRAIYGIAAERGLTLHSTPVLPIYVPHLELLQFAGNCSRQFRNKLN